MNITIVSVGKLKRKIFKTRNRRIHLKRLGSYCKFRLWRCQMKKAPENLKATKRWNKCSKKRNPERILSKIKMVMSCSDGD